MGTLQYNGALVEFDDRLLAHLQIVIVQKIRRGESFLMSWGDSAGMGDGHSAIWIHPTHNLYFTFVGGTNPRINEAWLGELTRSANSAGGLLVTEEPDGGVQERPEHSNAMLDDRSDLPPHEP